MEQLNSERIMTEIQVYVKKGTPYIDAVIEYAQKEGLEIELVGEIIKSLPALKAKILEEAQELRMVEYEKGLPI